MYSLFVVIILCNTVPYKSAFSTYSFMELVFRLVLYVFCLFCFEFYLIFTDSLDKISLIILLPI